MMLSIVIFFFRCSSLTSGDDFPGQDCWRAHQNLPDVKLSRGPPEGGPCVILFKPLQPSKLGKTQSKSD